MATNLSPNPKHLQEKKLLEEFLNDYPVEKVRHLLCRWFIAYQENDYSKLSLEDLREISRFLERLHQLGQSIQQLSWVENEGGLE